tara:strand:- start:476 stop:919 length:444 start_codon:yes stop_codon:yes gene_type:complete
MYNLKEIDKELKSHLDSLYTILDSRKFNISHSSMPTYSEHCNFVQNNPYRFWYFVEKNSKIIGTIYITYENNIGINLINPEKDHYFESLKLIFSKHKPLPPKNSIISKYFIINSNPNNINLINALNELRTDHIQNSYAYKNKDNNKI